MNIQISRRWIIFFVTSLLYVLSMFYRASIAVIAPELIADMDLNTSELGLISAAFFYAFTVTQIPIGFYLDKIGARKSMTVLSLIAATGALVFAWAPSFNMLLAGRLLMGIGMACNLMGTLKLITLWFGPARFATLVALVLSIGTAGSLVAATPLIMLTQAFGWRVTFTLFAALNLGLAVLFFIIVSDHPPSHQSISAPKSQKTAKPLAGLAALFKTRDYWIISVSTFCRYGVFASFQALWAGPFLMLAVGLSPVSAGNLILLMNIGVIVGGPLTGYLSDSVMRSRKKVVTGGTVGLMLVILALAFLSKDAHLLLFGALFFFCGVFSSTGMVMYPHVKELVALEKAGAAMTGINFFTMAGAAVFLQGFGGIMQHFFPQDAMGPQAFKTIFVLSAVILGLITLLYARSKETL